MELRRGYGRSLGTLDRDLPVFLQLPGTNTMPLVSMRQLLDHAAENSYGIPAFNVNNLEQVQAVMSAADEVGAPVILQASAGARKYAGEAFIKHLIQAAVESYPHIPLVMHQDHGQNPDVCQGAIDLGFTSVMMDGSLQADGKTIASYDYNVDVTKRVIEEAMATGPAVFVGRGAQCLLAIVSDINFMAALSKDQLKKILRDRAVFSDQHASLDCRKFVGIGCLRLNHGDLFSDIIIV